MGLDGSMENTFTRVCSGAARLLGDLVVISEEIFTTEVTESTEIKAEEKPGAVFRQMKVTSFPKSDELTLNTVVDIADCRSRAEWSQLPSGT